jgi:CHAD domain-containing protein
MDRNTSNSTRFHPVAKLRIQVTAIEAAISLVLAKPSKKSVHELRTSTRRIEAQLELLALLARSEPTLRIPTKLDARLRKQLAKLRKEAGKVRDLDVQRDLFSEAADSKKNKGAHAEAKKLRNDLKAERDEEADALLKLIQQHSLKLSPRLEKMIVALAAAKTFSLSPMQLAELTRAWFATHIAGADTSGVDTEGLHTIRKMAKVARYIADSCDGSKTSATGRLAARFETLQQAGGTWHDLLTARELADKRLGKSANLKAHFARREKEALAVFRKKLSAETTSELSQKS